jgi:hypothetical protein
MLLVGLGNGLALPTLLNVVLAWVAPDLAGAASGVPVTMQQVGATLGVAGIGTLFFAHLGDGAYTSATVTALTAVARGRDSHARTPDSDTEPSGDQKAAAAPSDQAAALPHTSRSPSSNASPAGTSWSSAAARSGTTYWPTIWWTSCT